MNKPIRCTTHFHACDCREYEFEMMKKENEKLRNQLKWSLSRLDLDLNESDWKKAFRLMVIHEVRHGQVCWNHPEVIEDVKRIKGEAK